MGSLCMPLTYGGRPLLGQLLVSLLERLFPPKELSYHYVLKAAKALNNGPNHHKTQEGKPTNEQF